MLDGRCLRAVAIRTVAALLTAATLVFPIRGAEAASASNPPMFTDETDGTNWPSVGRTYYETYYSPLSQVNGATIDRLKLAWYIDLPPMISALSTPLAVDGVVYFAVGFSLVYAADAASGEVLWIYDPKVTEAANDQLKPAWGIRGLAYADGRIFVGTQDGRLIALSSKTGDLLWSARTTGKNDGRFITGAPRVFNGKVIIGHGGADGPIPMRGYVTAYDVTSGKQLWRFNLVPGNPADGFENDAMKMAAATWRGEWWKYGGGGSAWNAMTYDPKYNRVYIGTGNGQPWNRDIRSPGGGDNLFLCSIVALDADTGEYVWHYQTTPGETWDYNSVMDIELVTLEIDGTRQDVILHAPKNGFFYVIGRATGKLIDAEPFTKVTWAKYIDKETGRPVETTEARYPDGYTMIFPGSIGAHNWRAMSYSPKTGLVYIPTTFLPAEYDAKGITSATWNREMNSNGFVLRLPDDLPEPDGTPQGALQAWDPVAMKTVWTAPSLSPFDGGALSTAGNLVFQGRANGAFEARRDSTGEVLWSFDAQNGILGQPITYTVSGKQYVTVIAGFAGSPAIYGPVVAQFGWHYRTQHRRVLTFTLDGRATLPPKETPEPIKIVEDDAFVADQAKGNSGGTLYIPNCITCHGVGAVAAGSAPDLRASEIILSYELFDEVVRGGLFRTNGMPQFDHLSTEDAESIRQYVRTQAHKARLRIRNSATQ